MKPVGGADGRLSLHPLATAYPIGRLCAIREPSPAEAAAPPHNPQRILRIRRTQPLQFMAAGFVCYSAAAGGCRLSLPDKLRWGSGGAVGGADGHLLPRILSSGYTLFETLPQPPESAAPPYNPQRILRIRRTRPLQFTAAGFVCYSAVAGGTGHCPARKLRWGSGGARSEAEPPPASPSRQRRHEFFGQVPKNRRIRELEFMVPEFVARPGGSKWVQAQPARNICVGKRFFIDSGKKSR